MNTIVQTSQLSKQYGRITVLNQMNLSVPEGSIYALLGPNGAGKSTTLQILMNLEQPSSGCAKVFGHDSRCISPQDFTQIGYVAEGQEVPEWMTIESFMAYLQPFYPDWDVDLARRLLNEFDLPRKRKLRHLSRGMRMKVLLASSLAYRPRLILMDEPFSALDSLTRDELVEGLLANAEGISILICSHDLSEIETFASHIGYLYDGSLQFSEETTALTKRFREIEITVEDEPCIPSSYWPPSWLNIDRSGSLIRFVDTQFHKERTMQEVGQLFSNVKQVAAKAMPLRSIFVTLVKAKRKAL